MLFSKSCVGQSLTALWSFHGLCVWASLCHNWFYNYSISFLKLSDILGDNCLKVILCVLMN